MDSPIYRLICHCKLKKNYEKLVKKKTDKYERLYAYFYNV